MPFFAIQCKVGRELEMHHFISRVNNVSAGFKQVWAALTIDVFRCRDRQEKLVIEEKQITPEKILLYLDIG